VTAVPELKAPVFNRAVVALNGGPSDRTIVNLVMSANRAPNAEVIGVHVVEIDWTLPLDADIAGNSEAAKARLEPVLLQARDVGAALVDEASERDADLLVVGLPFRKRFGGEFAVGRTIPYVLKNAPCAVWVVREPIPEETA
jgi:nucleotide-binding universal stress UspA family protein